MGNGECDYSESYPPVIKHHYGDAFLLPGKREFDFGGVHRGKMLHDIPECYICWYQMLPDKANSSEGPRVATREYLHSLRDKFADRSLGDTMRTPMSSTSGDSIMRFGRYEGTALKDVPLAYLLWTRADLSDECRTNGGKYFDALEIYIYIKGLERPSASKAGPIWTARVPKSDKTLRLYARPHVFASTQHSVDFTYDDLDCGYKREIIATELTRLSPSRRT